MNKLPYFVAFSYFLGIGPLRFNKLLKYFSSPEKAYHASQSKLSHVLPPVILQQFMEFRSSFDFEKECSMFEKNSITVLTREDPYFPPQLLNISDPPICLYVKGKINSYDFEKELFFGIVGTRNPTSYGKQIAQKFSYEVAKAGFTVVSGMALGIDTIAHQAALEAGKKTIAFLGCGVNIIYPPENRELYYAIIARGGLVISEFPPDMAVMKGLFVARNRLISGLSKGVLVAEGLKGSGSLITARYALEQGKEVFAPPAPITSDQSEAPNLLLKEGAKMVTAVEDILEEYQMSSTLIQKKKVCSFSPQEEALVNLLRQEPCTSDEISRMANRPVYEVLTVLSGLELAGIVEKNEVGKYQIRV